MTGPGRGLMVPTRQERDDLRWVAGVLAQSGYFTDAKNAHQIAAKILYGNELGLRPIESLLGVHIIEGRPSLSAQTMGAKILRSGTVRYRVREWTRDLCVLKWERRDDGEWEHVGDSEFSVEDAALAGINGPTKNGRPSNWMKFPRSMVFARALSSGARTYAPDILMSAGYVDGEIEDEIESTAVEVVDEPATPDAPEPNPPSPDIPTDGDDGGLDREPLVGVPTTDDEPTPARDDNPMPEPDGVPHPEPDPPMPPRQADPAAVFAPNELADLFRYAGDKGINRDRLADIVEVLTAERDGDELIGPGIADPSFVPRARFRDIVRVIDAYAVDAAPFDARIAEYRDAFPAQDQGQLV